MACTRLQVEVCRIRHCTVDSCTVVARRTLFVACYNLGSRRIREGSWASSSKPRGIEATSLPKPQVAQPGIFLSEVLGFRVGV